MHIVNIMFSKGGGGIEQSFVDYTEGLIKRGHRVTAITHPKALVNKDLAALGVTPITLRNIGEWDPIASLRLKLKLNQLKPDAILAHTSRSFALAHRANHKHFPLVGVAHNYNSRVRRMKEADAVFTTTHDLIRFVTSLGVSQSRVFHIPNMIKCDTLPIRGNRNDPPVIGSMGRFVKKKGFNVFIDALKIVHDRGYRFKAVLGGTGEEEGDLMARCKAAGLDSILTFSGWVQDKKAFYSNLDIFCLPSLHEPFGIVLLEAFTYGVPVVATDSEGPMDIINPNIDAVIVAKDNAAEMASAITRMLDDNGFAATIAANAFVKARTVYSIESVSERIEKALIAITAKPQ